MSLSYELFIKKCKRKLEFKDKFYHAETSILKI